MKTKHYYVFKEETQNRMNNNSLNQTNWEVLRCSEKDPAFCLEKSQEDYEKNCKKLTTYEKSAQEILKILDRNKLNRKKIISLGAGKGILEWHLKKQSPTLIVECTDYTEMAIKQLKQVFKTVDNVYSFDMINGDYIDLDTSALFLMYRVSTEFDIDSWYQIFSKMYDAEIEYVMYVPTELASIKLMLKEVASHIVNLFLGRKDTFCGWLYSESEFIKIFHNKTPNPLYHIQERVLFDNSAIFLLKRNSNT